MPDLNNLTPESEKYNKTFWQKPLGLLMTGGIGGIISRHQQKLDMAKAGQQKALSNIGSMQMAPESQAAYNASQKLMGQGLGEATKTLAIQENARMQNRQMSGLRDRRSALAGISAFNSNDFATRLAAQNEQQRQQNIMAGIQTGLQFGGQKTALDQYKNETFMNYYLGKQASANANLSGALNAVGSIAGSLIGANMGANATRDAARINKGLMG